MSPSSLPDSKDTDTSSTASKTDHFRFVGVLKENTTTSTSLELNPLSKRQKVSQPPISFTITIGDERIDFSASKRTKLEKLFKSVSKNRGVPLEAITFLYKDRELQASETLESIRLQDGDVIVLRLLTQPNQTTLLPSAAAVQETATEHPVINPQSSKSPIQGDLIPKQQVEEPTHLEPETSKRVTKTPEIAELTVGLPGPRRTELTFRFPCLKVEETIYAKPKWPLESAINTFIKTIPYTTKVDKLKFFKHDGQEEITTTDEKASLDDLGYTNGDVIFVKHTLPEQMYSCWTCHPMVSDGITALAKFDVVLKFFHPDLEDPVLFTCRDLAPTKYVCDRFAKKFSLPQCHFAYFLDDVPLPLDKPLKEIGCKSGMEYNVYCKNVDPDNGKGLEPL